MPGFNRALIEGGVIVASILLAFGIDAYWDAAQDRSRMHSHLEALHQEVQSVLSAVKISQAYRERRVGVMRDLLRQMTTGERADADTINEQLGALWGASRRSGDLATLEMMRSAGTFALIESDDLRLALIRYQVVNGYRAETEFRVVRYWEEGLRPFLASHTDALPQLQVSGRENLDLDEFQPAFSSGVEDLLNSRDFQNALLIRLTRTMQATVEAEKLIVLLKDLDRRLGEVSAE